MRGNKKVVYTYPNGNEVDVVEEDSAGSTYYTRTIYTYNTYTTTVSRKKNVTPGGGNDQADQTTTYTFYTSGGVKQYVKYVTDPSGTTTYYDGCATSGVLSGLPLGIRVIDSTGQQLLEKTGYVYNSSTGTVTSVEKIDPSSVPDPFSNYDYYSGTALSTENYTYYASANQPTVWLESHQDVRGCWTHYVRDSNNMVNVLAVQTAGPGLSTEPNWGNGLQQPADGHKDS